MCGIAAILKFVDVACPAVILERMRDEVAYRGPDDQGSTFFRHSRSVWAQVPATGSAWEVGLGHRRLSILDLSAAGHQPMAYRDKYWIVYNGEVYNFVELRTELERLGHVFHSSSDTEVILAAYAEWGPACFARFRGMWGLVVLDCMRNELILCRDRLGIKPLYLWEGGGIVAVASEIKQFRHLHGFTPRMDPKVVTEYLQTGYEDPRWSFFRGVQPVQAGTWLRIPLDTLKPAAGEEYWHPERVQVSVIDAEEAAQLFVHKVRECVAMHLRSDVPVGCALSGGLDSSTVGVLIDDLNDDQDAPLHTFTCTFPGDAIDEREYADALLTRVHAKPYFVTPEPAVFLEELNRFTWSHDEPVGGLSMYAGYCIARLTRQAGVPVTLNGQGGDEIFSGYWQSYFLYLRELWKHGQLLTLASHFTGALLGSGNPTLVHQIPVMLRRYHARRRPSLRLRLDSTEDRSSIGPLKEILAVDGQARRIYEIRTMYLPRLLKWDDRNSMAFSVEGRYPLLDHELIELCLSFAPETLYKLGWTKYPVRLGFKHKLPPKILYRRSKFGFETPQDHWLCGALRPALESWLGSDRPAWQYVAREDVRRLAEQTWWFQGKQDEPGLALFRIFVFDRWLEVFNVKHA
jgi:asparagine synthase (glutamine-hydrolysing)